MILRRVKRLIRRALRGRGDAPQNDILERLVLASTDSERTRTGCADGDLLRYFEARVTGRGIWKWEHYFEVYERHLSKFRGRSPVVCEVGVYSGGSLEMWRNYFGEGSHIYGCDIEPACKVYGGPETHILIGDQADRMFWNDVKASMPRCDVLIDDGGHEFEQQRVTFEEMFNHLRPGGVYICEDVHGIQNHFVDYVAALTRQMQALVDLRVRKGDQGESLEATATRLQREIGCIAVYPFLVVVEKRVEHLHIMKAPKKGTKWQPFLPIDAYGSPGPETVT